MRLVSSRLLVIAAALPAAIGVGSIAEAASAAPVTQIKSIYPSSGPEFSSIPVTVHGTNFNTAPGGTTVSFGGEPATSVTCSSPHICTAMTPMLTEGAVPVTVTSYSETSTNTVTFTYQKYAPPVVTITTKNASPVFSKSKLKDRYPGIFTPGNVYLQILNSSSATVMLTGPTGTISLEPGLTAGYNVPIQESTPYIFKIGSGAGKKQTLTLSTKTPK